MTRPPVSLLALALLLPAVVHADDEPEVVTVTTSDGWLLEGDYWAGEEGAPGVILLHQYHSHRGSWAALIPALRERGFHVLALDQRAHGKSTDKGGKTIRVGEVSREAFADLVREGPHDVAAAQALLAERGADAKRLALVGASYGCSVSLLSADALKGVRAVVLFSPGTGYFGVDVTQAMGSFAGPALIFAAEDDRQAAAQARELEGLGPDDAARRGEVFQRGGHGTALLTSQPDTIATCAGFLAEALS
jgi:pimeloyl-ACP methyl ester carboxylesterase